MKIIFRGICGCWYFFWGHILAWLFYDKRYLRGRWFAGRLKGLCAIGWEWVTHDALSKVILHQNQEARFPIGHHVRVACPENVEFDPDDLNNFHSIGIYIQAIGKVTIGKGTYIGPNVGIITANHDLQDLDKHMEPKPVVLGEKCWIGMNSVVLPGVVLGPRTIVGAGSVVTKSFEEGRCVIAGNPARKIRDIDI